MRKVHFRLRLFLIVFCLAALAGAQSKPQYELLSDKNVMVPMRDGVKLAMDIYRPGQNGAPAQGRFPTLLVRTPYTRAFQEQGNAASFVPKGYIFVVQSVRGRYGSEGHWRFFRDDPADGYDTIGWIASQTWSDGSVGMLGGSYDGGTQHAAALANPPALKALVPLVAATNVGHYGLRHNGACQLPPFLQESEKRFCFGASFRSGWAFGCPQRSLLLFMSRTYSRDRFGL